MYCGACEKNVNINSISSHIRSTALIKKKLIFGLNNEPTDRNHVFVKPDVYQLAWIVEEIIEDCMKFFIDLNTNVITT